MNHRFFIVGTFSLACACAAAPPADTAATAPSTPPMTRLRDYELTYQQELRKIQAPLISDYIARLQQLLIASPESEQPAIRSELERMTKLNAEGGIVDLRAAFAPQAAAPTAMPPPRPKGFKAPPGTALVLTPDTARGTTTAARSDRALTLGAAEWPVDHLDAGSYDIVARYSCPAFAGSSSLIVTLGGQEVVLKITPDMASEQFLLRRVAHFDLDHDLNNETLKLELKPGDLPTMQIRQISVVKPRPPGK